MNILNIETHRRKWSLIINGIEGITNEPETETRSKARTMATTSLKVTVADSHLMTACHRLSQKANAPILVRFMDLANRNEWLSEAKNLKNSDKRISISPDMPPVLRCLMKDILEQRKELPPDVKSRSQVKYLPRWPYVQ